MKISINNEVKYFAELKTSTHERFRANCAKKNVKTK